MSEETAPDIIKGIRAMGDKEFINRQFVATVTFEEIKSRRVTELRD
jgi:hypothetical protein